MKILYVLRTIAMYAYMFGYMLLFYPVLRQGEKAQAAGDRAKVRQLVEQAYPPLVPGGCCGWAGYS